MLLMTVGSEIIPMFLILNATWRRTISFFLNVDRIGLCFCLYHVDEDWRFEILLQYFMTQISNEI